MCDPGQCVLLSVNSTSVSGKEKLGMKSWFSAPKVERDPAFCSAAIFLPSGPRCPPDALTPRTTRPRLRALAFADPRTSAQATQGTHAGFARALPQAPLALLPPRGMFTCTCACVRIAQSPPQGQEQVLSTQLSCVPTPGVAPVSDTEANGGEMNGRGRRPRPAESNARGDDSRKKTRCPEVNNFSPRPTACNVPGPLPASTQSRVCTESKSSPTKSLPLCHRRLEELTAREDDLISLHNTE